MKRLQEKEKNVEEKMKQFEEIKMSVSFVFFFLNPKKNETISFN